MFVLDIVKIERAINVNTIDQGLVFLIPNKSQKVIPT
ncbi:MAG: hypothetical protein RJB66_272 [Pseudomonadota bacterium]|jgi:hypothetical protein